MVVEIGAGGEALAAHLTLVGLLAAVDAHVGVERARGAESFPADAADVRLLAGVRSHVPLQQTRTIEGFAADFARQHGPLAPRGACLRRAARGRDDTLQIAAGARARRD